MTYGCCTKAPDHGMVPGSRWNAPLTAPAVGHNSLVALCGPTVTFPQSPGFSWNVTPQAPFCGTGGPSNKWSAPGCIHPPRTSWELCCPLRLLLNLPPCLCFLHRCQAHIRVWRLFLPFLLLRCLPQYISSKYNPISARDELTGAFSASGKNKYYQRAQHVPGTVLNALQVHHLTFKITLLGKHVLFFPFYNWRISLRYFLETVDHDLASRTLEMQVLFITVLNSPKQLCWL